MLGLKVLLVVIILVLLAKIYIKHKYRYWKVRGIPYIKPTFPQGNLESFLKKLHAFEVFEKCYFKLKGTGKLFGGIYVGIEPYVLVLDLDFVKSVMVKDYQFFLDRGFYVNERDDPLSVNLVNVVDEDWKSLRYRLSPTFTGSKIKLMFPIMIDIADKLIKRLDSDLKPHQDVDLSDYLSRFTIDVIGSCAFGLDCDSLNNPNSEFLQFGKKAFTITKARIAKYVFTTCFRSISRHLRIRWTLKDVEDFYTKLIADVVAHREKENIKRNDFLDLMIQLKNKGKVVGEKHKTGFLTLNEIIANAHNFLLAGYDTSSALMKLCLLELAHHKVQQDQLRSEIQTVLKENKSISYESLAEMKYLDQVIHETLRMHPPFGVITKCITANYKVPNMDLTLKKGTHVLIPVLAFHHDSDIFPEPEKFDPDRFSPEAIKSRHPYAFLGFGSGPRNCIGMRFAMMQMKIGLASLLRNYKFLPCSRTQYPIKYSTKTITITPKEGCWLKVEKCS